MLGLHRNVVLPGGNVALPGSTRPGVSKPQIQNRENVVKLYLLTVREQLGPKGTL